MGASLVRMSRVVTECENCGLEITSAPVISRTSSGGSKKYYDPFCALKLGIILPKQIIQYNARQAKKNGGTTHFNRQRFETFFDRAQW